MTPTQSRLEFICRGGLFASLTRRNSAGSSYPPVPANVRICLGANRTSIVGSSWSRRRRMDEDRGTGRLKDEDIRTEMPGTGVATQAQVRDSDGKDMPTGDGTDGDTTDGTDGDARDADGTDTKDTDGTDTKDTDGTDTQDSDATDTTS